MWDDTLWQFNCHLSHDKKLGYLILDIFLGFKLSEWLLKILARETMKRVGEWCEGVWM